MATVSTVPSLTIFGRTFVGDELDVLKVLSIQAAAAGSGTYRLQGGSAGYQVPASKKLVIWGVIAVNRTGSTFAGCMQLGYGDNDVGQNFAGTPTNPIYAIGGNTGDGCFSSAGSVANPSVATSEFQIGGAQGAPFMFEVPATKYPFMKSDQACSTTCWALELDV